MLPKFLEKKYKDTLFVRHDDDGSIFYFSLSDFDGLKRREFSVKNQKDQTLKGYFYYYDGYRSDSVVVFDHGMGVGHRAYIREIETLCKKGYLVYSYDHTGCTESEGEHIRGFSGSLADLDAVISALKEHEDVKGKRLSVVGHSWGGFSTLNIGALHPDLHAQVAISGFSSVKEIQRQVMPFIFRPFLKGLYAIEDSENGKYAAMDAVESLKRTRARVLVIHSIDDKTVSAARNFYMMKALLTEKKNIEFLPVYKKDHNPNYTEDAVAYKNEYSRRLKQRLKEKSLSTPEEKKAFNDEYDFYRMTAQDEAVWEHIFRVLD